MTKTNDQVLFEMIARRNAYWREGDRLDRLAGDLGGLNSPKAAPLLQQYEALFDKACDLERRIAYADVDTVDAFNAKCRAIAEATFDLDDMIHIAFALGRQAERLGIHHAPDLVRLDDFVNVKERGHQIEGLFAPAA